MKTGRFSGQPERSVFRCGYSPDLLAALQENPGQPTPFFASVATLAVLAMLVILKNVMNDLYARDTSSKIKAVKLSTFKSGKYVGCYAPLGYKKSEADKHILEIDPVTAPVARMRSRPFYIEIITENSKLMIL